MEYTAPCCRHRESTCSFFSWEIIPLTASHFASFTRLLTPSESKRLVLKVPRRSGGSPGPLEPGARPQRGGGGGCARALLCNPEEGHIYSSGR